MTVTFTLRYKLAALGAGVEDIKRDRERHPIYEVAGDITLDEWVQSIPRDGAEDGGVYGVYPGALGKACMAFVLCGEDIAGLSIGENCGIKADVWERFLNTVAAIHGGDGSKPITLGGLLEDMEAKLAKATPEQQEFLTLRQADLVIPNALAVKPTLPAANASAADQLLYAQALTNWEGNDKHPYGWLRALTFGDLRDGATGRFTALGRLLNALPAWISSTTRAEPGFRRALTAIAKTAIEGTDIQLGDAADVAGCVADKLKLIDLPRVMESFGGTSQDARSRALLKEIKAVATPAARQELLRERFIDVASRLAGVRALVGVRGIGTCDMSGSESFGLCAEVATRVGIIRTEDEFAWASLRTLRDAIGHLDEMLAAEPWVGRTARARAEHVIDLHRTQARRASTASAMSAPASATGVASESAFSAADTRTRGAVPKHFQADVAPAMAQAPFRELKAAVLARVSLGGATATLDALQIAASGTALDPATNMPRPRQWCPLMVLLSEGPTRGADAATLDPELQMLSDAGRDRWPELYGRTAGLQLALDKQTLPEELEGWRMPELAKAFASSDWSNIDLGAAFGAARARMRCEKFKPSPAEKAYTTRQSIEDALEVAEALLMLRGFGGNGKGTLPFVLDEVRQSWVLYGGQGAHSRTVKKLAAEGRAYVTATLEHFGHVRHAAIATKNPLAPDHERRTTVAATQRWARHLIKLQGALHLAGYGEYFGSKDSDSGEDGDGAGGGGGRGGSSGSSGVAAKRPKKAAAKEGTTGDSRGVTMSLNLKNGTLTVTHKDGKPKVYVTARIRERAKNPKRCCFKGMAATALQLPELSFCDFDQHKEGCAEHQWAEAGAKNLSLCREERPTKRQKTRHDANDDATGAGGGDDDDGDGDDHDGNDNGDDGAEEADDAEGDMGAGGDEGAGAGNTPPAKPEGGRGGARGSRGRGKGKGRGGKGGSRGGNKGGRKTVAFYPSGPTAATREIVGSGLLDVCSQGETAGERAAGSAACVVQDGTAPIPGGKVQVSGSVSRTSSGHVTAAVVTCSQEVRNPSTINCRAFDGSAAALPRGAGCGATSVTLTPVDPLPLSAAGDGDTTRATSADGNTEKGFSAGGGVVRIQKPVLVQALTRLETPIETITIDDTGGLMRDASNAAGWPAIAAAALPCDSAKPGFSFEGNVHEVLHLHRWRRVIAIPDARQQAAGMGLGMAAVKAADGRLFAGMARWLYLWCVAAAAVCIVQPDVFVADFYDAPATPTTPGAWGDGSRDLTLLFWRGAPEPVPPHGEGSVATPTGERRAASVPLVTQGMARGVAEQLKPDDSGADPIFRVEIERLAAAVYSAGLPVPAWYDLADSSPSEKTERAYMNERGLGDGRRLDGSIVPRLVRRDLGDPSWRDGIDGTLEALLHRACIPAVSQRGRTLAEAYRTLRRTDAERVAKGSAASKGGATSKEEAAISYILADSPNANSVAVVPGRLVGGVVMLLLPGESHTAATVAGKALHEAHGATSEARKIITAKADTIVEGLIKTEDTGGNAGGGAPRARNALAVILKLSGVSLAVVVALAPPSAPIHPEAMAAGFSWQRAAAAAGTPRHTVACVAEQFIRRWVAATVDIHVAGARTGVAEAQPTTRALNSERLQHVDLTAAAREEAFALARVAAGLQDAATREPHLADALLCWREKVATAHEFAPPALVAALGREPPKSMATAPFAYRCTIPHTSPVDVPWMAPRWPVGVPKPAGMLDTYTTEARREIDAQLRAVERWNAVRVSGKTSPRPNHKSWSDKARLPWFQNRVLWERDGLCELIDTRLPATGVRMHREAVLWMLRDFPHRQLVSFLVHGVTLHDDLPMQTSIAANLLSFYEVDGGPDAVAEEMNGLKVRGWYLSSAGLATTAGKDAAMTEVAGLEVERAATGKALPCQAARLLTSPARINPRGAVPRKDLGPPRGVAELGHPRRETVTVDTGDTVTSINDATSTEHSEAGDGFWARKEVKPRPSDLMFNMLVLRAMGNLMRADMSGTAPAALIILFDYKYFFHALAYMAGEVWKTGCAVPARVAPGKASRSRLDVLLELVLAMGWTQASKVAQDFGNALMWLLLRAVDEALAPHISELRASSTAFDAMWRGRLALKHDDYGTQARIVTALQYTDDSVKVCLGAVATIATIVEFCRIIGPRFYPAQDVHEAARGTAVRSVMDEYGVALQAWRQLTPKGSVRAIGRDELAPEHTCHVPSGRGTAGGNPFPVSADQDAQRVTTGFACLLASVPGTTAQDVGALLGLKVAPKHVRLLSEQLRAHVDDLAKRVIAGEHLSIQCPGCRGPLQKGQCHALLLGAAVAQRCSVVLEEQGGPPADPVRSPPQVALGLDLEAAKMHKWHLGGSGIWTGVGVSATALVSWVPQAKAARCLVEIADVLDGRCEVARYRSLHGALADLVLPTGGGWYRMQGMAVPLQTDQELGKGPNVLVCERPQLWKRLKAWQTVLANSPGAPMVAVLPAAHGAKRTDVVTWDIGGDAAKDGEPKQGLGAWFYGVWWCAPLGEWPVLAAAHITCLELVEVGLGVVMTARWLSGAKRVRLRADAMAAFLTLRARREGGALARGAKAAELVAAHEVIMRQPEWVQLHDGEREVLVEQTFGESMLLHDAASRNNVSLIRDVSAALGIVPKRLELSERACTYLRDISLALAEVRRGAVTHTIPMHAAALEHGTAANSTGPRTPFAQAWPGAQDALSRAMQGLAGPGSTSDVTTSASRRARLAQDEERCLLPTATGAQALVPWAPTSTPDLANGVLAWRARRQAPMSDASGGGDERATTFAAALARCAAGRVRYHGPGADQIAPSRAIVTARAVAPPLRAVEAARTALLSKTATPATTTAVKRGAAELEESQRLLVERSIRDARCDEDGLGIRGASDELLRGLLTAAMLAVEKRFAPSTRGLDRSYWRMWTAWCDLIGTPPLRTNSAANDGRIEHLHRREVALALGAFMTWAVEAEQRGYKIESMLNRLRGVARRHWAVTIRFVSLALVVQASQGLVREHIDAHGADALRRRSKEPFHTAEIFALLNLPVGTILKYGSSFVLVGDNLEWQGVVVFINLYCTGGWRKEAIALGPKEVFGGRKLSLGDVTYRISNGIYREPSVEVLLSITWGDMCYVNPVPCKNDPDNSKFGSSPVPSRYHATQPICLVRELAKYEIMRMRADPIGTAKTRRKELPLVLSPAGRSWSKAELSTFFDGLIRRICTEERAKQLSVHSFRVWLACALLAAGATPEQIMLMVRWSSEAARKLYARLAMTTQCSLQAGAVDANFDSIRAHTLLEATSPATSNMSADMLATAEALRTATQLLDAVTIASGASVAPATDLRRTCSIDDDEVFGMLEDARHSLEGLAASADAALTENGTAAPESDSEDEP